MFRQLTNYRNSESCIFSTSTPKTLRKWVSKCFPSIFFNPNMECHSLYGRSLKTTCLRLHSWIIMEFWTRIESSLTEGGYPSALIPTQQLHKRTRALLSCGQDSRVRWKLEISTDHYMLRTLKQLKLTQRGCPQDMETVLLVCITFQSISDSTGLAIILCYKFFRSFLFRHLNDDHNLEWTRWSRGSILHFAAFCQQFELLLLLVC